MQETQRVRILNMRRSSEKPIKHKLTQTESAFGRQDDVFHLGIDHIEMSNIVEIVLYKGQMYKNFRSKKRLDKNISKEIYKFKNFTHVRNYRI